MSEYKQVVEIAPPRYQEVRERTVFGGYRCPVCDGRGGFSEQTGRDEYKTTPCDYCDGTGHVKAEVTIKWRPDYGE